MALIGYARVSSTDQNLEVQIDKLKAAGVDSDHIFEEKKSGTTKASREQLDLALRFARKGDVFVVTKIDRLARSVADLSSIVADLDARGVGFRVIDQSGIDTTTSTGRLLLNILATIAEFETDLRKERQRDGIDRAKANGVYKGRPAKLPANEAVELHEQGFGPTDIAKQLNISRASVYRFLRQAEAKS